MQTTCLPQHNHTIMARTHSNHQSTRMPPGAKQYSRRQASANNAQQRMAAQQAAWRQRGAVAPHRAHCSVGVNSHKFMSTTALFITAVVVLTPKVQITAKTKEYWLRQTCCSFCCFVAHGHPTTRSNVSCIPPAFRICAEDVFCARKKQTLKTLGYFPYRRRMHRVGRAKNDPVLPICAG